MEKSKGEKLQEKLFDIKKIGWETIDDKEKQIILDFNEDYIEFLNQCKTERSCVTYFEDVLIKNGFKNIENIKNLNPGDKVYYINRKKAIYAAIIGNSILEEGLNLIGAHIDAPRIDLKPNPLYEEGGFALFKTHYYGGIKKYQWTSIPLCIEGVVVKTNGDVVDVCIGKDKNDPIFTITDLLPHLGKKQGEKPLSKGIEGEDLNLLVGSIPYDDEKVKEKVKLNILNILNDKYDITERDFSSAELEIIPAFEAKSLGFDKSMVAGYGQDDRVCAYTTIKALLDINNPSRTCIGILSDKEEVGSMGNTGMSSQNFETFIADLLDKTNQNGYNVLEKALANSKMLSADVTSANDPTYSSVDDKYNAAYLGKGTVLCKYTGHGGKFGASDATAEFVAKVRKILEDNNIIYQYGDMGKVDEGGGGTIAYILANKGIDVIDCGVAILSMHGPYEVTSKFDIYNCYKVYSVFFKG